MTYLLSPSFLLAPMFIRTHSLPAARHLSATNSMRMDQAPMGGGNAAIGLLHAVLGTATVLLTLCLGRWLGMGRAALLVWLHLDFGVRAVEAALLREFGIGYSPLFFAHLDGEAIRIALARHGWVILGVPRP